MSIALYFPRIQIASVQLEACWAVDTGESWGTIPPAKMLSTTQTLSSLVLPNRARLSFAGSCCNRGGEQKLRFCRRDCMPPKKDAPRTWSRRKLAPSAPIHGCSASKSSGTPVQSLRSRPYLAGPLHARALFTSTSSPEGSPVVSCRVVSVYLLLPLCAATHPQPVRIPPASLPDSQ